MHSKAVRNKSAVRFFVQATFGRWIYRTKLGVIFAARAKLLLNLTKAKLSLGPFLQPFGCLRSFAVQPKGCTQDRPQAYGYKPKVCSPNKSFALVILNFQMLQEELCSLMKRLQSLSRLN